MKVEKYSPNTNYQIKILNYVDELDKTIYKGFGQRKILYYS